ncbi:hypothetical protein [Proteus phage P2-71]|nr:hypothetical protein [Proteus phage P2-71]
MSVVSVERVYSVSGVRADRERRFYVLYGCSGGRLFRMTFLQI